MTQATVIWEPVEAIAPAPSAVVGVVGGGHVARLLHQAAIPLDIELRVLTDDRAAPAVRAGARAIFGRADCPSDAAELVDGCDVVAFEREGSLAVAAAAAAAGVPVRPAPSLIGRLGDRALTRRALRASGVPVPASVVTDSCTAALAFAAEHGWPVMLKPAARPSGGGRGAWPVASRTDLAGWWARMHRGGAVLVEQFLPMLSELTVIVARRPSGQRVVLPVVETVHRDGVCVEACAPPRIDPRAVDDAVRIAASLADGLDVAGLLCVDLFVTRDLGVLVNDVDLGPHSAGHLTIDACRASQFEQYLRAVLDWPLGDSRLLAPVAMVNVLSYPRRPRHPLPRALAAAPARVHLYGVAPHPGRRLGHVTALGETVDAAFLDARAVAARLVA